ncbi:serine/threonine-protein kinase [Streptomyces sp. NPDC051567]|uniref:serine/threonine-protein kinase n=1 Tax=Streptomyces sp. NPDC051567 TaxID=3365660 RepID=UPI0037A18885
MKPEDAAPGPGRTGTPEDAKPPARAKPRADAKPRAGASDASAGPADSAGSAAPKAVPAGKPGPGRATGAAAPKAGAAGKAGRAGGAEPEGSGEDQGRLLAGRYRLGSVLGKGGMGTVWRAEDETLGRTVAVKELRFSTGVDEDEKRRLITRTLREAKAIARIRSGGAVTVYDVVDEDGRPWIVMELIEGPSLSEFVREHGPLTPHRAAEVGLAVLDVLRAAHGQGILHRDVKPSNVLIAGSGRVVLTDFGIAQVEGDPSVTSTGMLVGAPSYISPERARGNKPGPPADMWSLGGLLYAAVEGVPPYDKGSALATLTAVMTEPVDPPKNAGPLLTEVIYGLLAKDPVHRLDEERTRRMLTAVRDAPVPVASVPVPSAEETRQISVADARAAAEKAAAEKAGRTAAEKAAAAERAAEKAEKKERERREREQRERARAALKSARKAAAAEKAAAEKAEKTAAEPPSSRPAPVVAPLTDVMPRRTIVLAIAVVVVLAVVGSLIGYVLSNNDNGAAKGEDKAGTGAAAPAVPPSGGSANHSGKSGEPGTGAATGQADHGQQTQGQTQGQGNGQAQTQGQGQPPAQSQGATPGAPGGGLPPGYATLTDAKFRFSMAMPEGFRQTGIAGTNSGAIHSRDGGFPRIQVDFTTTPGNDARAAWAKQAPDVEKGSQNYRLIKMDPAEYRGYPTVADWEFEREQQGIKVRVLNRGFKADANHGYAIMISCAADQWDGAECAQMRETAFQTFQQQG